MEVVIARTPQPPHTAVARDPMIVREQMSHPGEGRLEGSSTFECWERLEIGWKRSNEW
ncbi:hypothetical protein CONPUDRAFT_81170 [Coniophora puteana RWD-64-598 SS2]|uniref:Uncharacterized protein n=1 Tax=Coniophora puteana (strain RWD-64-598) TaxID=741705 RepID=A0A5M3MVD8_CONPW|nr:uncharacterized protein CONPUDRAFT_81170 [Coniophora puteana RWD-64-598 SS2]EIW83093.1 hypothetical protein CONPUDRAFT_81170 [Coniophora puteana RWD-64-598 SS2]